ncbi:MAG: heavy metal translocating P-type ATPase [Campylobacterales bacterium]|nr:heavy metal translocating P-type ATPase [Campylobacterales bacterium]
MSSCSVGSCCSSCNKAPTSSALPWKEAVKTKRFVTLLIGTLFFITAIFSSKNIALGLYLTAYFLIGAQILKNAWESAIHGKVLDENFLMSVATIGAFAIGEYPEAVAVMLFFRVGDFFQDLAVKRSRKDISNLMDLKPNIASVLEDGKVQNIDPVAVKKGSFILVKPGEKVPIDGVIVDGSSRLNLLALTGESRHKSVQKGDEVLSGSLNIDGVLTIKTTHLFKDSTVSKILNLVENATSKKAKTEQFITKFAKYYTPFVVGLAILIATIPPLLMTEAIFSDWFHRALVFLVVSCPCALVISIPLSYFAGIAAASKEGILIKGGNYLEALNEVREIVFDKTGTLSLGEFVIDEVIPNEGVSKDRLLELAALAEKHSTHPIAKSILNSHTTTLEASSYKELSGHGVVANFENLELLVGNEALMKKFNISFAPYAKTAIYVAYGGKYLGAITLKDEIKPESKSMLEKLKRLGISKFAIISGDIEKSVEDVAKSLNIDRFFATLLPHEKSNTLEELLKSSQGKVAFVGDGINDAPSLALSDVGIAMGAMGTDAAIEAADVVIMDDNLNKIPTAIKIARKTNTIVWQNIIFALGVKGAILILGAFGIAGMWEAVFGDVGVAIIAILNATRILSKDL